MALLKTGSAYCAPAASTARMMEAIITGRNAVLPCSVFAEGEYGIKDIFIGLPVKLNKNGWSGAVDLKLNENEKQQLAQSAGAIAEQINKIKDRF